MSEFGKDPAKEFANDPMFKNRRRSRAEPGECRFCDLMREERNNFHPLHDASQNCQSHKRTHCSCDICF